MIGIFFDLVFTHEHMPPTLKFVLLLFLVYSQTCHSQESKTDQFVNMMNAELNRGDMDRAIDLADSSYKYACIEQPSYSDSWFAYLSWMKARMMLVALRFEDCEELITDVLAGYDTLELSWGYFRARLVAELGNVYQATRDYESAQLYYHKALSDSTIDDNSLMLTYRALAEVSVITNSMDSALYYLELDLELQRQIGDTVSTWYAGGLLQLALIHAELKDFKKADIYSKRGLSKWLGHHKKRPGYAYAFGQLAYISKLSGDYETALERSKKAMSIYFNALGKTGWYFDFLSDVGYCHYALGNLDSAYSYFIEIPLLERNYTVENSSFLSVRGKEVFINRGEALRNHMFTMLDRFENVYPEYNKKIYDYLLFYKGHSMKSLKELKDRFEDGENPDLKLRFDLWLEHRNDYYQLLASSKTHQDTLQLYLQRLENHEKDLFKAIGRSDRGWNLEYSTWKKTANLLRKDEVALEFLLFKDVETKKNRYAALLLTDSSTYPVYLSLCSEEELNKVLKRRFAESDFEYVKRVYESSDSLYQMIWSPVLDKLSRPREVFVSYSGLLHRIAHNTLNTGDGKILSDRLMLTELNSTSEIANARNDKELNFEGASLFGGIHYHLPENGIVLKKSNPILAKRGDPDWYYLENSEKEVDQLYEILSSTDARVQLFKGIKASEQSFRESVNGRSVQVIHVATHGLSMGSSQISPSISGSKEYARSGLVMAGAASCRKHNALISGFGDGILSAPEISLMNLSETSLVVLSSCESGLGNISNTDEVYGLQRAFKIAGAEKVIYSLWKIPDKESMEFMVYFYRQLTLGENVNSSYLKTREYMSKKYAPYYWASFQLVN